MKQTLQCMPPIIDEKAEILVLGSMPGTMSLNKSQYYAHPRNHFWPIMYAIFDEPLSMDYAERLNFIMNRHIALWDIIGSCEREGSSDGSITAIKVNDIEALLEQYPGIKLIILNGLKAESTYRKYLKLKKGPLVRAVKAPSTSPIPGRNVKSFEEKLVEWKQIIASTQENHN